MTDEDRQALADLALRALDSIIEFYGEDAELCAAALVYEVQTETDDVKAYHGNYHSLERNSPHHIAGLLHATGNYLLAPEPYIAGED